MQGVVGADGNNVPAAPVKVFRQVILATQIAVLIAADLLSVQPDITNIHDAADIQQYTLPFPVRIDLQVFAIPSDTQFLKTAGNERLLFFLPPLLFIRRLSPWLLDLVVMRQIQYAPFTVIKRSGGENRWIPVGSVEFPTKITVHYFTGRNMPRHKDTARGSREAYSKRFCPPHLDLKRIVQLTK